MEAATHSVLGHVADKCRVALLLIDVINPLDFPEAEALLRDAIPMAREIKALKQQAQQQRVPIIYVNDNFGRWRSDLQAQVKHCLSPEVRGRPIVELLQPTPTDYFVLKPKHSGFFSTTLDTLLQHLETKVLIITGMATNICVLFTANDAYMRDYELVIPVDCVAANSREDTDYALRQMRDILKATTPPWRELAWEQLME